MSEPLRKPPPVGFVVTRLGRRTDLVDWTDDLVEWLIEAWATGLPTPDIGAMMGVTKNVVIGKAHRLRLPERTSGPANAAKWGRFNAERHALVLARAATLNPWQLANEISETQGARVDPKEVARYVRRQVNAGAVPAGARAASLVPDRPSGNVAPSPAGKPAVRPGLPPPPAAFAPPPPPPVPDPPARQERPVTAILPLPVPSPPATPPPLSRGCQFPLWPHSSRPQFRADGAPLLCGKPAKRVYCEAHARACYARAGAA